MSAWLGAVLMTALATASSASVVTGDSDQSVRQKFVSTNLDATWRQTPLHMEVAEYLAAENVDLFWSFVDRACDNGSALHVGSEQSRYEAALQLVSSGQLLDHDGSQQLLKLALSLRLYSARVQAQLSLWDLSSADGQPAECGGAGSAFAVVAGGTGWRVVCSAGELDTAVAAINSKQTERRPTASNADSSDQRVKEDDVLSHADPSPSPSPSPSSSSPLAQTYSSDHHYKRHRSDGSSDGKTAPLLLVYGDIGSESMCVLHRAAARLATAATVDYVMRHHTQERGASKVRLSGYAVELAIKSTEYKAQDDTKISEDGATFASEADNDAANKQSQDDVEGFVFSTLRRLHPHLSTPLSAYQRHLVEILSSDLAPLKVWQLQQLSVQAAVRVRQAAVDGGDDALRLLTSLAQNFPSIARSLIRTKVDRQVMSEIKHNAQQLLQSLNVETSDSVLLVNGVMFDTQTTDTHALLDFVRDEHTVMSALARLGVSSSTFADFLRLDSPASPSSSSAGGGGVNFAVDFRDTAIQWMNDVATDRRYDGYPTSLHELLRPSFPGMLRTVRRNMYFVVVILDPADVRRSLPVLRTLFSLYREHMPLTLGVVWLVDAAAEDNNVTGLEHAGLALLQAFNYLVSTSASSGADGASGDLEKHNMRAVKFVKEVLAKAEANSGGDADAAIVTPQLVHATFLAQREAGSSAVIDEIFGADSEYDTGRKLAADYVRRLGLTASAPQVLFNGVALSLSGGVGAAGDVGGPVGGDSLDESLLQHMMLAMNKYTRAIYRQELTDSDNVLEWVVSQPNVVPRLNDRILKDTPEFVDLGGRLVDLSDLAAVSARDLTASLTTSSSGAAGQPAKYMHRAVARGGSGRIRSLTLWTVADLDTVEGRVLLHNALAFTKSSRDVRCAFFANPRQHLSLHDSTAVGSLNARAAIASHVLDADQLIKYLMALTSDEHQSKSAESVLTDSSRAALRTATESSSTLSACNTTLQRWRALVAGAWHLPQGSSAVLANGRLLGPLRAAERLTDVDLALLQRHASMSSSAAGGSSSEDETDGDSVGLLESVRRLVAKNMAHLEPDYDHMSDIVMRIAALISSRRHHKQRWKLPQLREKHSVVVLEPRDPEIVWFDLVGVCDPASRGAQHLAPLLSVLRHSLNARLRVILNARDKHSDMPVNSYYRLVLEAEPVFGGDGRLMGGAARFTSLPQHALLTQHYHVPDNWLVQPVVSPHDLDNIKLDLVEHGVHSDFELEHLLVEGHCFEQNSGQPPRGLQITLSSSLLSRHTTSMVDTIVMANLGYFQLKANPGMWALRLREGRSREIFDIVSVDGEPVPSQSSSSTTNAAAAVVLVDSFSSHVVKVRVGRRAGRQQADLLSDEPLPPAPSLDAREQAAGESAGTAASIWNTLKNTFTGSGGAVDGSAGAEDGDNVINIFSLASGHLYERLMRIMMLSVLRHTRTPVKFWFLKNYLSPTFKDLLGPMSREYGFRYELVQYKWPRWLHQQTDKQRIIWGYKILFLDVLFPLGVKKIIFVDADQIVRGDLTELRDLDLDGAPYGYTPFCDSRKEMDGFRFWKQGYWRSHLQGRKYHISALYVVDLKKFRQIAAGDRLRGQYQGLSQDPNSLSNLDQDLPNNMIHQVRIKSLPQHWLWCETWCDNASKSAAKTIDLCNNPQTKEAKLTAAARIAPEWVDYDNTIRDFIARLKTSSNESQSTNDSSASDSQSTKMKSAVEKEEL